MKKPLTKRQFEVFAFVRDFIDRKGYAPSLEEIGGAIRVSSLATTHKHVTSLIERGWLTKRWGCSRSLQVVVTGSPCPHCGQPMPEQELAGVA